MSAPRPVNGRRILGTVRGVPFPTVESIKSMLGLGAEDASKDAAIAALLESSLAMIESYCARIFMLDDYEERFLPLDARNPNLFLTAFPVETVHSVTRDIGMEDTPYFVTVTGWKLFPQQGVLRHQHGAWWWSGEWEEGETIVAYRGGFPPEAWPADLVDILTRLFFDRWAASGGTGSLVSGSAGGSGEIKSATVDGLRLDYDLGATAFKGGDVPPDLLPYAAALAAYRALDRAVWGV